MVSKNYEDREPWERREDESTIAYKAFQCYLNLGCNNRSKLKAYRVFKGSEKHRNPSGNFHEWCVVYQWVERCARYDDYVAEQIRKENEEEIKKAQKRHVSEVRNHSKVLNAVQKIFLEKVVPARLAKAKAVDVMNAAIRGASILPKLQEAEMIALGESPRKKLELTGDDGGPVAVRHMPPEIIEPTRDEHEDDSEEEEDGQV